MVCQRCSGPLFYLKKIEAINATFKPESQALWRKRHQLIDSSAEKGKAVRDEREAAVPHLRQKAADVVRRKHAAVRDLQAAVVDANFEVFSLTTRRVQ